MHIVYNCFAGISGDMNLAAMFDLGMDEKLFRSELSTLGLDEEFSLEISPAEKQGIYGTQVKVHLRHEHQHKHTYTHEQMHTPDNNTHHHHHVHRNYTDIENIIKRSSLAPEIQELSLKIFWEVALAEGKVHNMPPREVHFHEVGATDSIVDIVGAAICYYHLGIKEVSSTSPELGGGFVQCQHGKMPVPAPATVEILKGILCTSGAVDKEMTTPTGAAILKTLTDNWLDKPLLAIEKIAYGIGHRNVAIPNVLRIYQCKQTDSSTRSEAILIECNIDDMSPELLAVVPELLLARGAQDAFLTPIIMKKGRAASQLSVLCTQENLEEMSALIFKHSSTIGLRSTCVQKTELARTDSTLQTPWGDIQLKSSTLPDGNVRYKFELDDLKSLAEKQDCSIAEIRSRLEAVLKQP